ncbi:MAG: hypothetical protein P8Z78_01215 [Gammaproteobacteria bacterium]|jgi:hypothetical protein
MVTVSSIGIVRWRRALVPGPLSKKPRKTTTLAGLFGPRYFSGAIEKRHRASKGSQHGGTGTESLRIYHSVSSYRPFVIVLFIILLFLLTQFATAGRGSQRLSPPLA